MGGEALDQVGRHWLDFCRDPADGNRITHEFAVSFLADCARDRRSHAERVRFLFGRQNVLALAIAEDRGGDVEGTSGAAVNILVAALEAAERPKGAQDKFRILSATEVLKLPPIECEVDGILTAGGLSAIVGASNHGKSLFALYMALCKLLLGTFHLDIAIRRPGSVVYVAAEGMAGQPQRLRAALSYLNRTEAPGLYFLPAAPRLRKPTDVTALLSAIGKLPEPPALVFLDTERAMLDGSDSDDEARAEFWAGAARIAAETGAHVSALNHTGWAGERERGSTVLRAAVDTMLILTKEDDVIHMKHEKQRDLPKGPELLFQVLPWGESAVLKPITADDRQDRPDVLPESRQKALEALRQCDEGAGVSFTKWCETSGIPKASFARAVGELSHWGLIRKEGKKYVVVSEVG